MKHLLTLLATLWLSTALLAQIQAPDLRCATTQFNGDVNLEWTLPTNTCGTQFNGYRIYVSSDPTQPFTLLTIITNAAQTTYTHTNANGTNNTWYYYMTTDLVCPGEIPLQSVTLDNRPPDVTEIDYVTINDDGYVEIHWIPNPAPETQSYIILREGASGFNAIDTVVGRLQSAYEDRTASPTDGPVRYTIVAMDQCGNVGLVNNDPHQTLHLTSEQDPCDRTVLLQWNAYQNWPTGVSNHQIWVSIDGAAPQFVAYIGDTTRHLYTGVNDGEQLTFYITAVRRGSSVRSASSRVRLSANVVMPQSELYLEQVTVNPQNQVELSWYWDAAADLQTYTLLRADSIFNFAPLQVLPATPPLQPNMSYTDTSALTSATTYHYQLSTTDSCGGIITSNPINTIHLTGEGRLSFVNQLQWTPFQMPYGEVLDYRVYRIENGQETLLGTLNFLETTFEDEIDGRRAADQSACYVVEARVRTVFPNGRTAQFNSRSNTFCVRQPTRIRVPNAFAPRGNNPEFKPLIVFGEAIEYRMMVFNRWGAMVYLTNNPDQGWNGEYNGQAAAQGMYTYRIEVTEAEGQQLVEQGSVLLLR